MHICIHIYIYMSTDSRCSRNERSCATDSRSNDTARLYFQPCISCAVSPTPAGCTLNTRAARRRRWAPQRAANFAPEILDVLTQPISALFIPSYPYYTSIRSLLFILENVAFFLSPSFYPVMSYIFASLSRTGDRFIACALFHAPRITRFPSLSLFQRSFSLLRVSHARQCFLSLSRAQYLANVLCSTRSTVHRRSRFHSLARTFFLF